jgi:hypothetical protein
MVANSAPRPGDLYLKFNGVDNFVEIPSTADYSIATTGELSVSAWIRPDTLNFQRWERTGYVHWLGKGEGAGTAGQQEWAFRMYNRDHTTEHPPRPNRISFYVFNLYGNPVLLGDDVSCGASKVPDRCPVPGAYEERQPADSSAGRATVRGRGGRRSADRERRLPSGGQLNRTSSGWFAAIVINNRMVSGEPAYLVRCEDNIERWLTEKDLRP